MLERNGNGMKKGNMKRQAKDIIMGFIMSASCLMERSTSPRGGAVEKSTGNFIMYKF